jgi:hypothetical protein
MRQNFLPFVRDDHVLIWREHRSLTRVLSAFVAGKGLWLLWLQGRRINHGAECPPYEWFFAAVALTAAIFLARASWRRDKPS